MESILETVKTSLGIMPEYEHFDQAIIGYINMTLATIQQLGVGNDGGFRVVDASNQWSEFIPDEPKYEIVKTYVSQKVRVAFDPPSSSFVLEALNKSIAELEWRIFMLPSFKEGGDDNG